MKAIEYYEKYKSVFLDENGKPRTHISNSDVQTLLTEFNREIFQITEKRKAFRRETFKSIVAEINQKWNALCNIFKKKHGISPLKRDVVTDYWSECINEFYE
jgi:hypothetical protein